jgi:hypothetical protein
MRIGLPDDSPRLGSCLEIIDISHDPARDCEERTTSIGGDDTAGRAFERDDAQAMFESRHLLAQGRLLDIELLRRVQKTRGICRRHSKAKLAQIKGHFQSVHKSKSPHDDLEDFVLLDHATGASRSGASGIECDVFAAMGFRKVVCATKNVAGRHQCLLRGSRVI